uniref:Glucuronosyltransferase n=1 Tax=Panagrolaimus sp. PS1159 TaxID=55785 RepID=A0AC35GC96_9BILA
MGKIADTIAAAGHDVVVYQPILNEDITFTGSKHKKILNDTENIEKLKAENFDLGFTEYFEACGMGIFHKIGLKKCITTFAGPLTSSAASSLGILMHPSYIPGIMSSYTDQMTFFERIDTFVEYFIENIILSPMFTKGSETAIKKEFSDFSMKEAIADSAFYFVNSEEYIDYAQPITHKIIYMAGLGKIQANPLEKKYTDIFNSAKKGVILFSFGSVVQSHQMPSKYKKAFLEAFAEFPEINFIWKYEKDEDQIAKGYSNVFTEKWLPQNDILDHPKLLAFISHGGMNSVMEGSTKGIPMICIPVLGDQIRNSQLLIRRGTAIKIDKTHVTKEKIVAAIKEIITNESYRKNAQLLSKMVAEKPINSAERVIKYAEFAAEFGDIGTLQTQGKYHKCVKIQSHSFHQFKTYISFCERRILFSLFLFYNNKTTATFSFTAMSSTPKKRTPSPKKGAKRSTKRQRSTNKDEETNDTLEQPTGTTVDENGGGSDRETKKETAVNTAMEKFCQTTVAKKIEGLKAEFASLAAFVPAEPAATVFQTAGKEKNRYSNIPCYDKTRVILKFQVPPESDYIHANYVDTSMFKLSSKYICAQAPMTTTLNDWWRLIWQEKPKNIVMLCRIIENGKPKCAEYFPNAVGEQRQFGNVCVQFVRGPLNANEKAYESIMLRVAVGTEQFALTVHKWVDWPDFGVPSSGMGILRLLRVIRNESGSTCLIHCSAGVGRTGTVMAIDLALRAFLEGKEVNILEIIKEIRSYRASAVQTEGQYVFIHQCLIEYVKVKKLAKTEALEFATQYANYRKAAEAKAAEKKDAPEVPNPQAAPPLAAPKPPETK